MKSFEYTITDPVGIHARPAGILVKEIKKYASTVTVIKGEKEVKADGPHGHGHQAGRYREGYD